MTCRTLFSEQANDAPPLLLAVLDLFDLAEKRAVMTLRVTAPHENCVGRSYPRSRSWPRERGRFVSGASCPETSLAPTSSHRALSPPAARGARIATCSGAARSSRPGPAP